MKSRYISWPCLPPFTCDTIALKGPFRLARRLCPSLPCFPCCFLLAAMPSPHDAAQRSNRHVSRFAHSFASAVGFGLPIHSLSAPMLVKNGNYTLYFLKKIRLAFLSFPNFLKKRISLVWTRKKRSCHGNQKRRIVIFQPILL